MAAPIRIPNRDQGVEIVDPQGRPTAEYLRWLNTVLQSLAYSLNQLTSIPEIQAALDSLAAATQNAQDAADAANGAATSVTDQSNLANSYVDGLTMTATDAGASCTITISSHTRVYGDGTVKAVAGGSLPGLAYDTLYFVTYEDPSRTGGSVTYLTTTIAADAAQTGNTHVVGSVTTPLAAAPPVDGDPVFPPGAGSIRQYQ